MTAEDILPILTTVLYVGLGATMLVSLALIGFIVWGPALPGPGTSWWRVLGRAAAVFGVALFLLALTVFLLRDHVATQRCFAMQGLTWDSGKHCVIGYDDVVSTR